MNGAESLVHTLLACGVDTCFANPGTSEMHFVAALDRIPGMRSVLGLFEGVVTGAADGYARMTGRPAACLLHCGPGLANGLANLHNARRARTPLIAIIGDQATYHRPLDAPLTADTEGWARPVSGFVRTATAAAEVGHCAAAAVQAAQTAPGQIASLILPADTAWDEGGVVAAPLPVPPPSLVDPGAVRHAARVLRRGEPAMLLLGGAALLATPLEDAARIAAASGARLIAQQQNARIARGRGRVAIGRVPYPLDQALAAFAGIRHLILVGATLPVSFFAYPGRPNRLAPPDCEIHVLARPEQDGPAALAALADELGAPAAPARAAAPPPAPVRDALTPESAAETILAHLPEDAVVIDEAGSFGRGIFAQSHRAAPHDWLQLTGGAIGDGLPMATGAAIGAPGRRVVSLQADGSAMYTIQALWTQARERLDVTTIVFANRRYAILLGELANVGANPGPRALGMMSLDDPDLDWVKLAGGMGVEAAAAADGAGLADLLAYAATRRGPFLIALSVP